VSEVKGIKEIVEILDAAKTLAVMGKKIMADGKINLGDLPLFLDLLSKFSVLNAAYAGAGEAVEEVKDLSVEEAQVVIAKVMEIAKAIKAA